MRYCAKVLGAYEEYQGVIIYFILGEGKDVFFTAISMLRTLASLIKGIVRNFGHRDSFPSEPVF